MHSHDGQSIVGLGNTIKAGLVRLTFQLTTYVHILIYRPNLILQALNEILRTIHFMIHKIRYVIVIFIIIIIKIQHNFFI